jgi:hypothetical protein
VAQHPARLGFEIPLLEGRLATDTETDYAFCCCQHLDWSEVKIQKLRRLDAWIALKMVGAHDEEEEDWFVSWARSVNGDGEAITNFALRFARLRGLPVDLITLPED